MSFNEKPGQMNWKDELVWILISIASGILLSLIYFHFQRFANANNFAVVFSCCIGFYVLSILVRIQNHRGQALTGRPAFDEAKLKLFFPVLGFAIGVAL